MLHCLKVATKSHRPTPLSTFSKDVNVLLEQVGVEINQDESHLLGPILFAELVKHELFVSQKSSQHLARASDTWEDRKNFSQSLAIKYEKAA